MNDSKQQDENVPCVNLAEDALQAKANCLKLRKDFNFLLKCLNLFDMTCTLYDEATSSSLRNGDLNLDENTLDDLTNLVLSAQIASITTSSSDLILKYQTSTDSKTSQLEPQQQSTSGNNQNPLLEAQLTQLSIQILDKYFNIIYFLDVKQGQTNLFRNLNAKCIYVMMVHLNKLIQIETDIKMTTDHQDTMLQLIKDLEMFSTKLLKMLRDVFKAKSETSNNKSSMVFFKDFNVKLYYTNGDLFNFLNNGSTHRFFTLLLNLFKTLYTKSNSINSSSSKQERASSKSNPNQNQTPIKAGTTELHKEIKNIDESSSDEETVVTPTATAQENVTKNPDEDPDEYLLIGSWFEDQLLNQNNSGDTNAPSTIKNNSNNDNVSAPVNSVNDTNSKNDIETQIGTSLKLSDELMKNLLDFIKDLLINDSVFVKEFIRCYSKSQTSDFCTIVSELESNIDTNFLSETFITSFYRFIEFLIVRNLLDYEKQDVFISCLNVSCNKEVHGDDTNQNLFMNKRYLSILCQIFVLRLKNNSVIEKTKQQIISIWDSFLKLIEIQIEKRLNENLLNDGKNLKIWLFLKLNSDGFKSA
jgi:hypothetical protein